MQYTFILYRCLTSWLLSLEKGETLPPIGAAVRLLLVWQCASYLYNNAIETAIGVGVCGRFNLSWVSVFVSGN